MTLVNESGRDSDAKMLNPFREDEFMRIQHPRLSCALIDFELV